MPAGFPSAAPELPPRGSPSGQTPFAQTPPRIGLTTPLPNPSGALPKAGFTPTGTRKLGATTFSRTASELGTERVDRQRKVGMFVGAGVLAVGLVIGIVAFVVRSDPPETKSAASETKAQVAPPPPTEPVAPKPPANVRVQVTSRPAAELWIEGEAQARGRTPLSLELPRGAAAKATLRADAHADLSIDLPTAADGSHSFTLAPRPAEEPDRKKRRSGPRNASTPQKGEDPYRAVGD